MKNFHMKMTVMLVALILASGWIWASLFGNDSILVRAADDGAFAPLSSDFAGGSGTEEDPYIIETAEQLDKVRDYLDAHFALGANIDLSAYSSGEGWLPITTDYSSPFTGTFDGNGYQITGLKIDREDNDYQSLFGVTSETAVIRNVHLEVVEIIGANRVGGLVGYSYGIIENSTVTGTLIQGNSWVGGLVGEIRQDLIASSAHINVVGNTDVGGLAGQLGGSNMRMITIRDSFATGDVTGKTMAGGLVGTISTGNMGSINEITNSYATGEVNGDELVGGLVGKVAAYPFSGENRIKNSYATGNVNGDRTVGGLIGYNFTSNSEIEVVHCFAIGKVSGNSETGGLVGENYPSVRGDIIDIVGSYWLTDSYTDGELPDNGIGTPVEEADLLDPESFKDWDLTEGWYQYDGHRPFLQWQNPLISWDATIADKHLSLDDKTNITVNTVHQNGERYDATTTATYTVDPNDPVIVHVDPNGEVSAVKGGKASITVSLFDKSETFDIVVDSGNPEPPTITLYPDDWTNAAKVEVTIDHSAANPRQTDVHTIRVKVGEEEWDDHPFNGTPIHLEVTEEGQTKIQAQAIDDIGNKSTIVERTVKISRSGLKLEAKLFYSDDADEPYVSGVWTNQSVTAAVYTSHDHGITIGPVSYSLDEGATWDIYDVPLIFSDEGEFPLWVQVKDEADNEMSERLVIRIDQTGPVILYDPDGDENLSKSIAARVTVLDDASGIDHSELDYVWSTSEVQLDEHANWQPFMNNSTLSHTDKNGGDWYLHIRAKDEAGNESYGISKRFRLEQEPDKPTDPEPPKQPNQPDRSSRSPRSSYSESNNARLSALTLSIEGLTPEFSANITEYEAQVAYEVDHIELTIQPAHQRAVIRVNGERVRSESIHIPLEVGINPIEIVVIAEDGTEKSYSLNVERMPEEKRDASFRDISGHWAESSIESAIREGFVNGYPDGTFKPDHAVTRAEFTVMLARALHLEGESGEGVTLNFADSEQIGDWAKQAIAQAVEAGIVSGYEDGTFQPEKPITRVEMAAMIAQAIGVDLAKHTQTNFTDDADIPSWAKGFVEAIREMDIINGRDDNLFAPHDSLTRAEATISILRLLERLS